MDFTARQF